jgi:hypothetical protein
MKKIEEGDGANNDMYIVHVKRYFIRICSWLGRRCDI